VKLFGRLRSPLAQRPSLAAPSGGRKRVAGEQSTRTSVRDYFSPDPKIDAPANRKHCSHAVRWGLAKNALCSTSLCPAPSPHLMARGFLALRPGHGRRAAGLRRRCRNRHATVVSCAPARPTEFASPGGTRPDGASHSSATLSGMAVTSSSKVKLANGKRDGNLQPTPARRKRARRSERASDLVYWTVEANEVWTDPYSPSAEAMARLKRDFGESCVHRGSQ
jgi:hypothetical protein